MKTKLLFLTVIAALFANSAFAGKKYDFTLNWKPGKHYVINTTDQTIDQTVMGMSQKMQQDMKYGMIIDLVSIDENGTALLNITYDRIITEMKSPMGEMKYDSSKIDLTQADPQTAVFAAMVGHTIQTKYTKDGQVQDVKGFNELFEKIFDQKNIPEQQREPMKETFKRMFGDESMAKLFMSGSNPHKQKTLEVGQSWDINEKVDNGFSMHMTGKATFVGIENGLRVIESDCKLTSDNCILEMMGAKMDFKFDGNSKSTEYLNEDGLNMKTNATMDFDGNMKLDMPGGGCEANSQQPQTMEIPMKIHQVVTTETLPYVEGKDYFKTDEQKGSI